jgi:hypothetical protein
LGPYDLKVNGLTVGVGSTTSTSTVNTNTALGNNALRANTSGSENTAVGYLSQEKTTTGKHNTSIGIHSMLVNTTGEYNASIGSYSLYKNISGTGNTAVGSLALYNATGGYNVAVGMQALVNNTTPSFNTGIGTYSLFENTTGANNTGLGSRTLQNNITGGNNLAVGSSGMFNNTTGSDNISVGNGALLSNKSNNGSLAIGHASMYYADDRTTGRITGNTAVGHETLRGNTPASNNTGRFNTAVGGYAMSSNSTGSWNTALGYLTLSNNTTGFSSTALGESALKSNTTGDRNVAIGSGTLINNTTGKYNVAIGSDALQSNVQGDRNVAIGLNALRLSTGFSNTAVGFYSLEQNNTGQYNSALGDEALYSNTSGNYNTAIGNKAMSNNTSFSNSAALGYNAQVTASNQIRLGNTSVTEVATSGKIIAGGGLVPGKYTAAQRDAIVNPDQGLMIYCTNCGPLGEVEIFNGNEWKAFTGANTAAVITNITNGLVASFPLDGSNSGSSFTIGTLLSTNTYNMTNTWSATLAATDPSKTYRIVVNGTWGIANGNLHRDAAYDAGSNNTIGSSGTPVANRGCDANWSFDGSCPPPVPNSPAGYAANNTYEYIVTGKAGGYAIAFSDGNYSDNRGSLTFKLYELNETVVSGTTNGTVTYTTNRKGTANSAMQGGAGYITAPSSLFQFTRTQAFTVSVWFTADNVTSSGRLLSTENSEGNFRIAKYNTGRMAVQFGDYQETDVTTGVWHHLVYTYNNRTEKVYIDNVLVSTNTDASNEALNYGAPFTIGAKAASAFDKWAGKIDDVKIYNRALVPSEVSVLFNQ